MARKRGETVAANIPVSNKIVSYKKKKTNLVRIGNLF